jgi:hypothetical protein
MCANGVVITKLLGFSPPQPNPLIMGSSFLGGLGKVLYSENTNLKWKKRTASLRQNWEGIYFSERGNLFLKCVTRGEK